MIICEKHGPCPRSQSLWPRRAIFGFLAVFRGFLTRYWKGPDDARAPRSDARAPRITPRWPLPGYPVARKKVKFPRVRVSRRPAIFPPYVLRNPRPAARGMINSF